MMMMITVYVCVNKRLLNPVIANRMKTETPMDSIKDVV